MIRTNWLCRATLVAVGLGAASASSAATIQLVTNGGFEEGFSGFTTDFDNDTPVTPNFASVSVLNGNYFGLPSMSGTAFLAVNGATDAALGVGRRVWSQDVTVTAGTEYSFSFLLAGTNTIPTPVGQLSVQFDGMEILNASAPASATILSFGTLFTADTSGTFALSFVEQSTGVAGHDYALDDISLSYDDAVGQPPSIPLPAGSVLLLSAVGAGALLRRRKRTA